MVPIVILMMIISVLSGCGKKSKKIAQDPLTQIDYLLNDDEYSSQPERVHAKEVARLSHAAQQAIIESLQQTNQPVQLASDDLVRLFEAKLADIPVPMGSKPIKNYFDSANSDSPEITLGYSSEQSLDDLALFYVTQMEQLGWHQVSSFYSLEHLLVFENMDQICAISLRVQQGWFSKKGSTQIILFRGLR